jgi:pyridoxine kinase
VLVTSLEVEDTPPDAIDLLVADGRVRLPRAHPELDVLRQRRGRRDRGALLRPPPPVGLCGHTALGEAAASVHGLLRATADAGSREILTVGAQEEFVAPSQRFAVEEV